MSDFPTHGVSDARIIGDTFHIEYIEDDPIKILSDFIETLKERKDVQTYTQSYNEREIND